MGVAKTAREEKLRARAQKLKEQEENAKMEKLYRKHVLGEKEQEAFVPLSSIQSISPAKPAAPKAESREEVGSMGD